MVHCLVCQNYLCPDKGDMAGHKECSLYIPHPSNINKKEEIAMKTSFKMGNVDVQNKETGFSTKIEGIEIIFEVQDMKEYSAMVREVIPEILSVVKLMS